MLSRREVLIGGLIAGAVPGRKPTDLAVHRQADDGKVMNMLPAWVPDAATRRLILVENPARLYGF